MQIQPSLCWTKLPGKSYHGALTVTFLVSDLQLYTQLIYIRTVSFPLPSALDNESERIVQQTLDDMQKKKPRTTLVVAHRLTTVKNCDKIAVLDRGGVKELGSHMELLKEKGLYNDLWIKQGAKED